MACWSSSVRHGLVYAIMGDLVGQGGHFTEVIPTKPPGCHLELPVLDAWLAGLVLSDMAWYMPLWGTWYDKGDTSQK